MATCRKKFIYLPDRFGGGGGVNPSGQPDRFLPVFFLPLPIKNRIKITNHQKNGTFHEQIICLE